MRVKTEKRLTVDCGLVSWRGTELQFWRNAIAGELGACLKVCRAVALCGGRATRSTIELAGGTPYYSPDRGGSGTVSFPHLPHRLSAPPLDSSEHLVLVWRRVWEEDRAMEEETRTLAQTSRATK